MALILAAVPGATGVPASAHEQHVEGSSVLDDFQRVPIVTDLANAIDMVFTPDGRILILNRFGAIVIYDPATQATTQAGQLPVYTGVEAGMLGIAVDPDFENNGYIYLYFSPAATSVNRLSRFTLQGNVVDLNSEVQMLDVPVDRNVVHHEGGNLKFDPNGNLYIGTGDNTFHSAYAALNENNSDKSAEKSASNTMDLRGKILRIHPESDGSYTVPAGNLFANPTLGLPEIYVMGARNPFKFSVDDQTGWLFWADVGPDADNAGNNGPVGLDEINLTTQAGNYGWPYFVGDNLPYRNTYLDYFFDPALPTNDSRWNTGPRELPPAQGAWLDFVGQAYMAGPVYRFDNTVSNPTKLPDELDGHFIYWDFNTSRVWIVGFDSSGNVTSNEPWTALNALGQGYIDMEIGPDDQLYVLEYGTGCCAFDVGNGVLSRYDYLGTGGGQSPVAVMAADPRSGPLPLTVDFSSAGSFDPDGGTVDVSWDFETDGIEDATTPDASFTYTVKGVYNAQLRVTDPDGNVSVANTTIHAGNTIADVTFAGPAEGGMFRWQEFVDLDVAVVDAEDGSTAAGTIPCSSVVITPALGHLDHTHDTAPIQNCDGTIQVFTDHNNNGEDDLYYSFLARYTDADGLDSFRAAQIYPMLMGAEFHDGSDGVQTISNTDTRFPGLNAVRAVDDGSYIVLSGRNLVGIDHVSFGVASGISGTSIEVRVDSPTGPLVGSVAVPNTGDFNTWTTVTTAVTDPGGLHDLYLVFDGDPGQLNQLSLSAIEFSGPGISYRTPPELTTIEVTPSSARVVEGDSQMFSATTLDQYGDPFPAAVAWGSDPGGTITSEGLFSATTAGTTPTVIAAAGSVSGTAQVTVPLVPAVLFVSGTAPGVPSADLPALARVQSFTSDVIVVDDDGVSAGDAAGKDLIVITSSVVPSKVQDVFTATAVPLLTWEPYLFPSLGMTGPTNSDRGETGNFKSVNITDPNHPLAAGLTGTPQVLTVKRKLSWGEPSPAADVVATLTNSAAHPTIFAYDTGDSMVTGTAPATRIGLFMDYAGAKKWTPAGESLFDASLTYALVPSGPPVNQPPVVNAGPDVPLTPGDPFTTAGSYTDDGIPTGGTVTTTWTGTGPGTITFTDPNTLATPVTFSDLGTYTLTLTVNDGELTANDTTTITIDTVPPVPPGNLAEGMLTVASSSQSFNPPSAAVDGDIGTRWSSLFDDPEWIYVDLGAEYPVDRVVLNWETAYGEAYQIQVSDDAATWATVFSESGGDGAADDISFAPQSGRYVRMYGTQRGTQWGYSLWEFEVYGDTGAPPDPPVLTEILVTPATATVTVGASDTFTAVGRDQYGDNFPTSITWSVSGGGTISGAGLFTSTGAEGTFTVTATSGSIEGTAAVTVVPDQPILGLDSWERVLIDGSTPRRSPLIDSADIDGDGDPDLVTGGWWYENPGGAGGSWVRRLIGGSFGTMAYITDVDGDGDTDVVGTTGTYVGVDLVWAENDGTGSFTIHDNVPNGTSTHGEAFPADAAGGDFGGTSDFQIALTWNGGETGSSGVQLLEIPDSNPDTTPWTIQTIHNVSEGEGLTAGDIDGDGDLDLFQGTKWLRSDGASWTQFTIASFPADGEVDRSRLADLDGDGDLDAVVGFLANHTRLVWLEQPADPTQTWTEHVLDADTGGGLSLGLADMDNDGDIDVVLGEHRWPKLLTIYENVDNASSWTPHTVWGGGPIDHHDGSLIVDFDGDGDLDIFSLGWKKRGVYLYENKAID